MSRLIAVVLSLVVASPVFAGAPSLAALQTAPSISSRYTPLGGCREIADEVDGEDGVDHRCQGYGRIPVWLSYRDSTRAYFGFGARRNLSGMFSAERDDTWPIEWRGRSTGGRFQPFAVILRVRGATEPGRPSLVVFRLRADGTSCVVGSTDGSNDAARRIADASLAEFECKQEPQSL